MVPEIALNALFTAVCLVGFGLYGEGGRLRARFALAPLLISLLGAGLLGVLVFPVDVLGLPRAVRLESDLATLLAAALLGVLGRGALPSGLPGPPILVAPLLGALLGELPAATILGALAPNGGARARLALAAMAGGFVGRLGDPALLLLGRLDPHLAYKLLPLSLLALLLGRPRAGDLGPAEGAGDRVALGILVGSGLIALIPQAALPALVFGAAGLALRQKRRLQAADLAPLAWTAVGATLVVVAVAGGGPGLMAFGFEQSHFLAGRYVEPALTLGGALGAFIGGGSGASLFGVAFLDRAVGAQVYDAPFALAAGVAAGSVSPLIAADGLRHGWWRQLLLVVGAVAWVGWGVALFA